MMTPSNAHPYPLSFPHEDQRILISTYSSLANALGTDPGYASLPGRKPTADCDAVTDRQTIYLDRPPVSNPSYPYPARNVFNPGTYPERTPSSTSSGRLLDITGVAWSENSDRGYLRALSQWYDRLPQPRFLEPNNSNGYQVVVDFPAIHFRRKGNKMPYSLWDLLSMNAMPDLVDGDVPILAHSPDRWIKIKLIWPGYPRYALEKRISTKGSRSLTPNLLLVLLANHMHEFVRWMQNEGAAVEPGQEHWTVTEVSGGASAMWKNCVIASLQHLAGSIWQPEIYYLRG